MIKNKMLTGIHKSAIAFFMNNVESVCDKLPISYDDLLSQINSATISIENTPYYCIIKFYHNGYSSDIYDKTIEIQVVQSSRAPVVFHMYLKSNMLYEFEYFTADLREICDKELFAGNVYIKVY